MVDGLVIQETERVVLSREGNTVEENSDYEIGLIDRSIDQEDEGRKREGYMDG